VEFRSSEASITDFENAAFACVTYFLTRIILEFNLNFYMPLSKIDENMETAHKRASVVNNKFWFRKDIFQGPASEIGLFSIADIINGSSEFVGIIPIIRKYLSSCKLEPAELQVINQYLKFIEARANGTLKSTATWIRDFVRSHPLYKFDSIVSESIAYDLCKTVQQISNGQLKVPELLGDFMLFKETTSKF